MQKNIWKKEAHQKLIEAFLSLENKKEAKNFLRDILTESEIEEFSKRLQAAHLLLEKTSYKEIEKKTSLSSTTVARISKWLSEGYGGYKKILERIYNKNY